MVTSEYLVLPANASPRDFPNNKNNSYKVRLPKRLNLQSNRWLIALRSINYSNNWYNVGESWISVRKTTADGQTSVYKTKVREGRYLEAWTLLAEMRVAVNGESVLNGKVVLHYDETRGVFHVTFADDAAYAISFSEDLAVIFNIKTSHWYEPEVGSALVSLSSAPDVFAGYSFMYVYCNLCEPRVVGHAMVPLLMEVSVSAPEKSVRRIHESPAVPQYVPVANTDTDEVHIDIRRGDGEPFLFKSGVVSVTVEIREV